MEISIVTSYKNARIENGLWRASVPDTLRSQSFRSDDCQQLYR